MFVLVSLDLYEILPPVVHVRQTLHVISRSRSWVLTALESSFYKSCCWFRGKGLGSRPRLRPNLIQWQGYGKIYIFIYYEYRTKVHKRCCRLEVPDLYSMKFYGKLSVENLSWKFHGIPRKSSMKIAWKILHGITRGQKLENSTETPWNSKWNIPWNYHGTRRVSWSFHLFSPM